jgi:hypothetical protein
MLIILKRISEDTTLRMIEDFVESANKASFFRKGGKIEDISIIALQDCQTDEIEYHGLVSLTPDSVAERVIKELNGKSINDKNILVSEYHYRFYHNDPRLKQVTTLLDKRHGERRRKLFKITPKAKEKVSTRYVLFRRPSKKTYS